MKLEISQELAQKIINYLASKPFAEVFQLIGEMQQLKPVEVKKEIKKEVAK